MLKYKSIEANMITYSNIHTIQAHVVAISDFGKNGYVMHESVQKPYAMKNEKTAHSFFTPYSPYTILWKLPFRISPCSKAPLAKCDLIFLLHSKSL